MGVIARLSTVGSYVPLAFATLMVFSPAWLYFARFVRHDVYLAFCNMGAVYFAFRFGESRKLWHFLWPDRADNDVPDQNPS